MNIRKSFREIREFNVFGRAVMARHANTKLSYAITKVLTSIDAIDEYNAELEDIRIENCYTNKDGVIEYDVIKGPGGGEQRQYRYTKETLKKKFKEERELMAAWDDMEIDIKSFLASEVPGDLSESEKNALEGFVLKEGETPVITLKQPALENGEELKEEFDSIQG